ncbi:MULTISPECIES: DUF3718 domain-containing protein [Alteromonadaceae]|uniref:DUF3718 domain-containing protein n=1 Tax=Alteromonadaceae TaxID=72275 RepID=UPI001C09DC02|nr:MULTISPECIES: DUF3718 domain-containing protein [Aliiglaciecola]MBU2878486.1 DUF3718 domain-containing protein [Aliiglaciecola lipolytica]MDO6709698.1 DUF3718 domain-containing protein [Aliiglaciecola sp. 2_MG-2023]MDO6750760.1 DUF3718 domain-containing protein [Aliiglaciecola sp. 1_MG-2023]
MKKLVLASLLALSVPFTASASESSAESVKFIGDLEYASFCKAVVNNDVELFKLSLNRFVGELGSSRKRVLKRVLADNNVTCSGQSLVEFSAKRNATQIGSFITAQAE